MTREELMEAVVEAAEAVRLCGGIVADDTEGSRRLVALEVALSALDAHRPEPEGEMVEVRGGVWLHPRENAPFLACEEADFAPWPKLATITARAPLPRIPEIAATVEPVEAGR